MVVTTPILRQSRQTWIPIPMAEAQTTRPPTVKELLAKQAVKEISGGPMLEAPPPTALRSPPAREGSIMEVRGQEPIITDKEVQKEPMVPSSRKVADEPVIPTNLEHQVVTTGVTVVLETDALTTEKERSTDPPSIETRTVETQRGNYVTIDTRILEQWGRLEMMDQSPAETTQGATQPKPALGPAGVPSMVEVELVQTTQATTSQLAPSAEDQRATGSEPRNDQKTQGGGHRKGKLIGAAQQERTKREAKEENGTPAFLMVKRTDQPRQGGLQYQGPCLMASQRYPHIDRTIAPLRVAKARLFRVDGRIKIVEWRKKQILECHEARLKWQQVVHHRFRPGIMALKEI